MLDRPKRPAPVDPPPPEKRTEYWQMTTCQNEKCSAIHILMYNSKDELIAEMSVDQNWIDAATQQLHHVLEEED